MPPKKKRGPPKTVTESEKKRRRKELGIDKNKVHLGKNFETWRRLRLQAGCLKNHEFAGILIACYERQMGFQGSQSPSNTSCGYTQKRRVSESSMETIDAPETHELDLYIEPELSVPISINYEATDTSFSSLSHHSVECPSQRNKHISKDETFNNDTSLVQMNLVQKVDDCTDFMINDQCEQIPEVMSFNQGGAWRKDLLAKFDYLREREELCDMEIHTRDNEIIGAHRVIVACSSPVLKEYIKTRVPSVIDETCFLNSDNISCRIWKLLLSFMYTGQVNVTKNDLEDFQEAARYLKIRIAAQTMSTAALVQMTSSNTNVDQQFIKTEPDSAEQEIPPNPLTESTLPMVKKENLVTDVDDDDSMIEDTDNTEEDTDEDDYIDKDDFRYYLQYTLPADDEGSCSKPKRKKKPDDPDFQPDLDSDELDSDENDFGRPAKIAESDDVEKWIVDEYTQGTAKVYESNTLNNGKSSIDTSPNPKSSKNLVSCNASASLGKTETVVSAGSDIDNASANLGHRDTVVSSGTDIDPSKNPELSNKPEYSENSDSDSSDDAPSLCLLCGEDFQSEKQLKNHSRTNHHDAENRCSLCLRCFPTSYHCEMHVKQCIEEKQCKICDKVCINSASLVKHIARRHPFLPFKCLKCGLRFDTKNKAVSHIEIAHKRHKTKNQILEDTAKQPSGDNRNMPCPLCGKAFKSSLRRLEYHIWTTHKGRKLTKCFKCDLCGIEITNRPNFKRHMEAHLSTRTYNCDVCGNIFKGKFRLNKHMLVHGSKEFMCKYCGRQFTMKKYLVQHERIHSGEKPYICHHCGVGFAQKNSLDFHFKTYH